MRSTSIENIKSAACNDSVTGNREVNTLIGGGNDCFIGGPSVKTMAGEVNLIRSFSIAVPATTSLKTSAIVT